MAHPKVSQACVSASKASVRRQKPLRLKLQELEPRIAPSSLLQSLPFLGLPLGRLPDANDEPWGQADDAGFMTDLPSRLHDRNAAPLDLAEFAPVEPSQRPARPRGPAADVGIDIERPDGLDRPSSLGLGESDEPAPPMPLISMGWDSLLSPPQVEDGNEMMSGPLGRLSLGASPLRWEADMPDQSDQDGSGILYTLTGSGVANENTAPDREVLPAVYWGKYDDDPTILPRPDETGPRVTSVRPAPDSTEQHANEVAVTFDELLAKDTVNGDTFKVSSAPGEDGVWATEDDVFVEGTVTYNPWRFWDPPLVLHADRAGVANGMPALERDLMPPRPWPGWSQAQFIPDVALPNGEYAVWLDGTDGITDRAGNALDGEFSGEFSSGDGVVGGDFVARFTVSDPIGPRVTSVTPWPGAVAEGVTEVMVGFDEALNAA
ncbi:MAG: hypothetical protein FJ276_37025, partial [Planctomycetes bacterium]|nr:hypothetical protein [Planctomycetota bacterium]